MKGERFPLGLGRFELIKNTFNKRPPVFHVKHQATAIWRLPEVLEATGSVVDAGHVPVAVACRQELTRCQIRHFDAHLVLERDVHQ